MNNTNHTGIHPIYQQVRHEAGINPLNNPYIQKGFSDNPYIQQNPPAPQQTPPKETSANTGGLFSFLGSGTTQKDMLKGALIGAVATFILTNEDAQKAIFKNFAKLSSLFEVGIEELKERYEDAKAEVSLTDD